MAGCARPLWPALCFLTATCSTAFAANGCRGGPSTAVANAVYTTCNVQDTGGLCDVACATGYRRTGGSAFTLACSTVDFKYTDASSVVCVRVCDSLTGLTALLDPSPCSHTSEGTTCKVGCKAGYTGTSADATYACVAGSAQPQLQAGSTLPACAANACSGGPAVAVAKADYTSCAALATGGTCTPTCTAGYTKTAGAAFTLLCAADRTYADGSGVACPPAACTGGPVAAAAFADYAACNALATDALCNPACAAGYSKAGGAAFRLACDAVTKRYTDTSGVVCAANTCGGGANGAAAFADYSSCATRTSGQTCTPTCLTGYTMSTAAVAFTLSCDAAGRYADLSTIVCTANACNGGPTVAAPRADYAACNTLVTGASCTPGCTAGYKAAAAAAPFALTCAGGRYADLSGVSCTEEACTGGPTNGQPLADYAACNLLKTGGSCTVGCKTGYAKTAGAAFVLSCVADRYADGSGVACVANKCTGGPTNARAQAVYTACNARVTGQDCAPSCAAGYLPRSAVSFTLVCTAALRYMEPTGVAGLECIGELCRGGPNAPIANMDYTTCSALRTGGSCTLTCLAGYAVSGAPAFTLSCPGEKYDTPAAAACTANTCTGGPVGGGDAVADYTECNKLATGAHCTPVCQAGYYRAQQTLLSCDATKKYTDPNVCLGQVCTSGPTNPATHADYTACLALKTGDMCTPVCAAGYTATSAATAFKLACVSRSFTDGSTLACGAARCTTPPTSTTVSYAACVGKATGDQCTPACATGYQVAGGAAPPAFTLLCDGGSGAFADASPPACEGLPCTGGPATPAARASYTACNALKTGGSCTPVCVEGYTATTAATAFTLACTAAATYADGSGLVCGAAACAGGPSNAAVGADYTACAALKTGGSCTPTCGAGYGVATAPSAFTLLCAAGDGRFADGSGIVCSRNACAGGPATTPPANTDYSSCNTSRTGDVCTPGCVAGYAVATAGTFTLSCDAGGRYALGATAACAAAPCAKGPRTPATRVDYAACNTLSTGASCLPVCGAGFIVDVAATAFVLKCDDGWYADSSGLSCKEAACTTVATAAAHADYSSCVGKTSGMTCEPACVPGYERKVVLPFALACRSDGTYDDGSFIQCVGASCVRGVLPATGVEHADYSACNLLRTGESCKPTCTGGHARDPDVPFALLCVEYQYNDTSAGRCVAAKCRTVTNAAPHQNHTDCFGKLTGETCTVGCNTGYRVASSSAAVELVCGSDGSFEDTSNTVCEPYACDGGPTNPGVFIDHAACNAMATGATCAPVCDAGYRAEAPAVALTPFNLSCAEVDGAGSARKYTDPHNTYCVPAACTAGPTNAPPLAQFELCNARVTGETCTPSCQAGSTKIGGAAFRLVCDAAAGGAYAGPADLRCEANACTAGPRKVAAHANYTACSAQATGGTCDVVCDAGAVLIGSSTAFTLLCAVDGYDDASGAVCQQFEGECLEAGNGELCASAGQHCNDTTLVAVRGDWRCSCILPLEGSASGKPATCTLDECAQACPTCAGTVCSDARQACLDPDQTPTALRDWLCVCPPPTAGNATATPAQCRFDECTSAASVATCATAGQACKDVSLTKTGDWQCECTGGATGSATGKPAACVYAGECVANSGVCSASQGQSCVDPDTTVAADWLCRCAAPYVGSDAVGKAAECVYDECTLATTVCGPSQSCVDPIKSLERVGNWVCRCPPPLTNLTVAAPAVCVLDECEVNAALCEAGGQRCVDANATAFGDWECQCLGGGVGAAVASVATCVYGNECDANAATCTAVGQFCTDPSTTVTGDWTCTCITPAGLPPVVGAPASCIRDECLNATLSATCTAVGQECRDTNTSLSSLDDWVCGCVSPQSGVPAAGAPATCVLDECAADPCGSGQMCVDPNNATTSVMDYTCMCSTGAGSNTGAPAVCALDECTTLGLACLKEGQTCEDPVATAASQGDWVCKCAFGLTGEATAKAATCEFQGECIVQNTKCKAGETCVDPNLATTGDWFCAAGGLDECVYKRSVCEAGSQDCVDPVKLSNSTGDWRCNCVLPLTGTAVGRAAVCDQDECQSDGKVCETKLQSCVDLSKAPSSLGDWLCGCVPPSVGVSVLGKPAACALDECLRVTTCSAAGQTCVDPVPSPDSLGDYQCVCPPSSTGMPKTGAPAACDYLCRLTDTPGYTVACTTMGAAQCLVSELLPVTCATGYAGASPVAACSGPGEPFVLSGCTSACDLTLCPPPTACRKAGVCDPARGCVYVEKAEGTVCDDGTPATTLDLCVRGRCIGVLSCGGTECYSADECNRASCAGSDCRQLPVLDGTPCSFGTSAPGECRAGSCELAAKTCGDCAAKAPCRGDGACDANTGLCTTPVSGDGTACDDGVAETTNDRCRAGRCAGDLSCGGAVCEPPPGQCRVATCVADACRAAAAADGAACDDGDATTSGDKCTAGVCVGVPRCATVTCPAATECAGAAVCEKETGRCVPAPLADGTMCDDGNAGTDGDVCTGGRCGAKCIGVVCPVATPCSDEGRCSSATGLCVVETNRFEGRPCDDGDDKTVQDRCQLGVCRGVDLCAGVSCTAANDCREVGRCDHTTGTCSTPVRPNGSTCDDKDALTTRDSCLDGLCQGLLRCGSKLCPLAAMCKKMTCSAAEECVEQVPPTADPPAVCDDRNAATANDTCWSGVCLGCPACAETACRHAGACDPATGKCIGAIKLNGSTCDDGDADTIEDRCDGGECKGTFACGDPVKVPCANKPLNPCARLACSPTHECGEALLADDTPCDDRNPATLADTCKAGACAGTAPCASVTCFPTDQCHRAGVCDPSALPGRCTNPKQPDGTPCDDHNFATRDDACLDGRCVGVDKCANQTCAAFTPCHHGGACTASTGLCTAPPMPSGTPCADLKGTCETGRCMIDTVCGGRRCPTLDTQCAEAYCEGDGTAAVCKVRYFNASVLCYDGDASTQNDHCEAGRCVGVDLCKTVVCRPRGQCYEAGECDPRTGKCTTPLRADGGVCSDYNDLTVNDKCAKGQCVGESKCLGVVCNPSDACHGAGACDPVTGLCSDPPLSFEPCNDGNPLTTHDVCSSGLCAGSLQCGARVCAAADSRCRTVSCGAGDRCVEADKPDGTACNDFNPRTTGDVCAAGVCAGVDPCAAVRCDDTSVNGTANPCLQTGVCLRGTCTSSVAVLNKACDDGDAATHLDVCFAGECEGVSRCASVACTPPSQCHAEGLCDPVTGACSSVLRANGTLCDDGSTETVGDACAAGVCRGRPLVPSYVRVEVTLAVSREEAESKRFNLLRALSQVLGLPQGALKGLTVSEGATAGTSKVSFIRVDPDVLGPASAKALEDRLRADILKGTDGTFKQAFLPATSFETKVLRVKDECTPVTLCAARGQDCVDNTPYEGYSSDWVCACRAPLAGSAPLGPATCAAVSGATHPVPLQVLRAALNGSTTVTGIADVERAYAALVADTLGVDPALVRVTLEEAAASTGTTAKAKVHFSSEAAAPARRALIKAAACCPHSCAGSSVGVCERLGLAALRTAEMGCNEYDAASLCGLGSGCRWEAVQGVPNAFQCRAATANPDDDGSVQWIILAVGGAVLLLLLLLLLCCLGNRRKGAGGDGSQATSPEANENNRLFESREDGEDIAAAAVVTSPKMTDYEEMADEGPIVGAGSAGAPVGKEFSSGDSSDDDACTSNASGAGLYSFSVKPSSAYNPLTSTLKKPPPSVCFRQKKESHRLSERDHKQPPHTHTHTLTSHREWTASATAASRPFCPWTLSALFRSARLLHRRVQRRRRCRAWTRWYAQAAASSSPSLGRLSHHHHHPTLRLRTPSRASTPTTQRRRCLRHPARSTRRPRRPRSTSRGRQTRSPPCAARTPTRLALCVARSKPFLFLHIFSFLSLSLFLSLSFFPSPLLIGSSSFHVSKEEERDNNLKYRLQKRRSIEYRPVAASVAATPSSPPHLSPLPPSPLPPSSSSSYPPVFLLALLHRRNYKERSTAERSVPSVAEGHASGKEEK